MRVINLNSVSVVIPTHNRVFSLLRLLKSIDLQKNPPDEVIVVNDGSNDKTKSLLDLWQKQNHKYKAIAFNNPCSKGPGAARNIGIQLASGEAIAFTDDDCIVDSHWVKIIKKSKVWNVDKKIAGIGGRILPYRNGIISEYYTFHRILEPPKYNQYLVTANACYLKDKLLKVNGFDESHRYPGGEDNGLSFKLINLGYIFGYENRMIVRHDYRNSLLSFIKTFYRYGKGCAEITYKYIKNQFEEVKT